MGLKTKAFSNKDLPIKVKQKCGELITLASLICLITAAK